MTSSTQTTAARAEAGPDPVEGREGRAAVVTWFWSALDAAGVERPQRMGVEDWQAMRTRLTQRLAYLDRDNLATLAELTIEAATGPRSCHCPAEVTIRALARGLQTPPVTEARIVTSWLASKEGPPAIAGGYEVELFRWLKVHARPPFPLDMREIRDNAREAERQIALIRERIARETASPEDRAWLEAYLRDRDAVRQIVRDGQARKAAQ